MKLTIWIRPDKDGNMTLRTDYKNESADTPNIHRYGHRLLNAIEGGGLGDYTEVVWITERHENRFQ